jgi:FkbM family methyltransferase
MANNSKGVRTMIIEIPGTDLKFDLRDDYDTDNIVIKEIFEENVYEVHDTHFNRGGVVVDIGANIGAFSIFAAQYADKVYAIEPEPHNLKALKNNISINDMNHRITIVEYGISDFEGTAVISDEGGSATIKDDGIYGAKIKIITLDNLFSLHEIDSVDVLKVDVEGSELEIILGASQENLNKCKYITMEYDIRSGKDLGKKTQKLSETHHVRTMGSWERGGMIWAWLY